MIVLINTFLAFDFATYGFPVYEERFLCLHSSVALSQSQIYILINYGKMHYVWKYLIKPKF